MCRVPADEDADKHLIVLNWIEEGFKGSLPANKEKGREETSPGQHLVCQCNVSSGTPERSHSWYTFSPSHNNSKVGIGCLPLFHAGSAARRMVSLERRMQQSRLR